MDPALDAALRHPVVQKHPLMRHLAGERERVSRAEAKHEAQRRVWEEHEGRLAAWRRACDQAVAEGDDMPPKPPPPDYDLGRGQHVIHQQKLAVVEQARSLLADAAPDLLPELADAADKVVSAAAKGRVADLPKRMVELEAARTVLIAVARCRWGGRVVGYRPLDHGQMVDLAVSGQGSHGATWAAFLEDEQRRAEEEARQAAEMAVLAERAATQTGALVQDGSVGRNPDPMPVEYTGLAGRR